MNVTHQTLESAAQVLAREHPRALIDVFGYASLYLHREAEHDAAAHDEYQVIRWAWQQFVKHAVGSISEHPADQDEWEQWQRAVLDYADNNTGGL